MLTQNVGGMDRVLRVVLGLGLIAVGFFLLSGIAGTVIGLMGFIPLVTGLVGWCPLYLPLHFDTRQA